MTTYVMLNTAERKYVTLKGLTGYCSCDTGQRKGVWSVGMFPCTMAVDLGMKFRNVDTPICLIDIRRKFGKFRWLNEMHECLQPHQGQGQNGNRITNTTSQEKFWIVDLYTFTHLINKTQFGSEKKIIQNLISHILNNTKYFQIYKLPNSEIKWN